MKTLSPTLFALVFAAVTIASHVNACYTAGDNKFCIGDTVHCLDSEGKDTVGTIKQILSNGDLFVSGLWTQAVSASPEVKCLGNLCKDACVYIIDNMGRREKGWVKNLFTNGKVYIRAKGERCEYSAWRDIKEVFTAVDCDKRPKPGARD